MRFGGYYVCTYGNRRFLLRAYTWAQFGRSFVFCVRAAQFSRSQCIRCRPLCESRINRSRSPPETSNKNEKDQRPDASPFIFLSSRTPPELPITRPNFPLYFVTAIGEQTSSPPESHPPQVPIGKPRRLSPVKNTIRQQDLDAKLSSLALDMETYDVQLAKLVSEYDALDAQLESRDPDSWRSHPRGQRFGSEGNTEGLLSERPKTTTRALSIEEQFRAEVERITIQSREDEADLARRIEFARLRFEKAMERAGIDPDTMAGYRPQAEGESEGSLPLPVLKRWNELHLLRTELVERNLYLVLINVERYAHTRVSRMDLIQEGSAVLFRAADGFDWKRGLLFRTYAVHWLNQAFRSYLYNFGNTVRVPVYLQKAMKHVRDAMERMGDRGQDVKALAEATDLGENVVNSALRASRSTHSIDSSFATSSGDGLSLRDTLTDDEPGGLYSPEMEDVGLADGAEMALSRLSARERHVIGLRFGLDGNSEHTLAQIAEEMGVSLERIRQIQVRAITKMDTPGLRKAVAPFLAEGA